LFAHAIVGCDTTSAVYGLGKVAALKLVTSTQTKEHVLVFTDPESTKEEITAAGEAVMVSLYKGKPGTSLDSLRLQIFHQKVTVSKTFVDPRVLPPSKVSQLESFLASAGMDESGWAPATRRMGMVTSERAVQPCPD